jgi:magnesium chelatase subunit D
MTSPAEVADRLRAARALYPKVTVSDKVLESLVATAIALGIPSARVDRMALAAARAHAAWRGAQLAAEPDATAAARLVLAPRARQMPATDKAPDDPVESGQAVAGSDAPDEWDDRDAPHDADADRVLAATLAALPHGLLDHLRAQGQGARKAPTASAGRTGLQRHKARRGRPTGATPGDPRHDGPLDLLATVEAAAPWQAYRRRQAMLGKTSHEGQRRLLIAGTDLRVTRFRHCRPATTIIAVDASGSSALHRLGEAKGAVELLLAECYVRRDKVALISFRGKAAEIVLPPTRSLARAKRVLSGLPGGGATPLASGIDAARQLASLERRSGHSCLMVILTDGRANMSRRGLPGRKLAHIDAESAASLVRAEGLAGLFIDTSPRGSAEASALARLMSAPYVPLPHAEAGAIVDQIQKQSVHT